MSNSRPTAAMAVTRVRFIVLTVLQPIGRSGRDGNDARRSGICYDATHRPQRNPATARSLTIRFLPGAHAESPSGSSRVATQRACVASQSRPLLRCSERPALATHPEQMSVSQGDIMNDLPGLGTTPMLHPDWFSEGAERTIDSRV